MCVSVNYDEVLLCCVFISEGQRHPLVAGSVGPYGAFLQNGSEYTGAYAEEMSTEVSGSQQAHTGYIKSYFVYCVMVKTWHFSCYASDC